MKGLAALAMCASLSASGATSMKGKTAPDLFVADWVVTPEVNLRTIRGRKAVLLLYHTAC